MWPPQEADDRRFQLSHVAQEIHNEVSVSLDAQIGLDPLRTTNKVLDKVPLAEP